MNIEAKQMYSEIYSILNLLGSNYINKIPGSLWDMIKEEKLEEYSPKYVDTMPLEKQQVKRESLAMIALFYLNYWCDEKEKQELEDFLEENEQTYQEQIRKKYNSDNIFKKKMLEKREETQATAMREYKKHYGIIFRIINLIKKLIK